MVLSKTLPRSLALNLMLYRRWRSGWLECVKCLYLSVFFLPQFSWPFSGPFKIFSFLPDYCHDLSTSRRIILSKHCVSCLIFLFFPVRRHHGRLTFPYACSLALSVILLSPFINAFQLIAMQVFENSTSFSIN